ncbi:MAG: hypothetical protein QOF48_1728 [Verrucomicrobiota bacterium]|jgi:hypothetical protein
MTVKAPPQVMDGNIPCDEAGKALGYSIAGIVLAGILCSAGIMAIIFSAMGVTKALQARKLIQEDPRLTGEAKANIALILGSMACILWLLGIIGRAKSGN